MWSYRRPVFISLQIYTNFKGKDLTGPTPTISSRNYIFAPRLPLLKVVLLKGLTYSKAISIANINFEKIQVTGFECDMTYMISNVHHGDFLLNQTY